MADERDEPLLLRMDEAAKLLSISPSMVRKLAAAGQLPVIRLGASVRIPVEQLQLWIRERATAQGSPSTARPQR